MLMLGIARPPQSIWSPKKATSGDRVQIIMDSMPEQFKTVTQLDISKTFRSISEAKTIFSTVDLVRAFNQIPVAEGDIPNPIRSLQESIMGLSVSGMQHILFNVSSTKSHMYCIFTPST
ncbi:hypothetical protein JTB14_036927 [Gonioctena quinquepunctata]|nr:hypothetical protein JTB14_036927 [Gonioctena quinquepunctata]